jgi:predicted cation transporter
MWFVWIAEQTAIISLYSINLLVIITETECVYCAVRTKCINVTQVYLSVSLTILTFSFHTLSFLYCSCQKDERAKPGNLLIN